MKNKIRQWIRNLILWAADEYYEEATKQLSAELRTQLHHSRDHLKKENKRHWDLLNTKITALQAIDLSMRDDPGKLIIMASVQGQDIVKVMDLPRNMSITEHRQMISEMMDRYGARPSFVDGPAGTRRMFADMQLIDNYHQRPKRGFFDG